MSSVAAGFRRGVAALDRGTAWIAGSAVLAMTLLGTADVLGRALLDRPLLGQVEITRILLVYAAFLGLAEAEASGSHVRLRLLDPLLSSRTRALRDRAVGATALLVSALVTGATAVFFWDSWRVAETLIAPIPLPAWLAKLGILAGFLLLTARLASGLLRPGPGPEDRRRWVWTR